MAPVPPLAPHPEHTRRYALAQGIPKDWPAVARFKSTRGLHRPQGYNICYRRVALQTLVHIPKFLNWIDTHQQICSYNAVPGKTACLACLMSIFGKRYWESDTVTGKWYTERCGSWLRIFDRKFRLAAGADALDDIHAWRTLDVWQQEDAGEHLQWLVGGAFGGLIGALNRSNATALILRSIDELKALFMGANQDRRICPNRRCKNATTGPMNDWLGLDITLTSSKICSIQELVNAHLRARAEDVEDSLCDACSKHGKRPASTELLATPEVVVIVIHAVAALTDKEKKSGRTTMSYNTAPRKIVPQKVDYGLWLDLSRFQAPGYMTSRTETKYQLSSVVFHSGLSFSSGHYSGIFRSAKSICRANDDHVEPANVAELLGQMNRRADTTPYILTYIRTPPKRADAAQSGVNPMPLKTGGRLL